jgi:hypothetical protein
MKCTTLYEDFSNLNITILCQKAFKLITDICPVNVKGIEQMSLLNEQRLTSVAFSEIFSGGGSTNSVEDRRQRKQGSGGGSPLVRGSAQFVNE